jgi:hypothetical protein
MPNYGAEKCKESMMKIIKYPKQDAEPCGGGSKLIKVLDNKSIEERVLLLEETMKQLLYALTNKRV